MQLQRFATKVNDERCMEVSRTKKGSYDSDEMKLRLWPLKLLMYEIEPRGTSQATGTTRSGGRLIVQVDSISSRNVGEGV
jgi:hypothetical protein